MVKRVSTRFLDSDSLSDCYGWEAIFEEDRPIVGNLENISDEELSSYIAPKRRGRPKRPYLPPTPNSSTENLGDLGEASDQAKFPWE